MIKFTIEDVEYELPEYTYKLDESTNKIWFVLEEGDLQGVTFTLNDLMVDKEDNSILHYDLEVDESVDMERIKPIADNLILKILYDSLKYKDEQAK